MAALIVTGVVHRRATMTALWAAMTIAMATWNLYSAQFELQGNYSGPVLVYFFITGIVAFHWKEHIRFNRGLFAIACVVAYVLMKLPQTTFIVQFPLMYIMLSLGLMKFPKWRIIERGDYSYGMYLYSYPVQQTLSYAFPSLREWWIIFPLSVVITYGIAAISWHSIEKPALKFKKRFGGAVMQSPPAEAKVSA